MPAADPWTSLPLLGPLLLVAAIAVVAWRKGVEAARGRSESRSERPGPGR
ncbi:MAG: hypothetical protein IT204_15630 [Fimbriimonadaceae bacterium]|nr:hypothetical protein [Fimbriimonadaceae bacterium]